MHNVERTTRGAVMTRRMVAVLWMTCTIAGTATLQAGGQDDGETDGRFWPAWRGPLATGEAPDGDRPIEWSESRNVRWKVAVPGRGSGSPIVWGDRVYVLTAVPVGEPGATASTGGRRGSNSPDRTQRFTVLAYDRADGRLVWERIAREERPLEATQANGTLASHSAVTDGERLFAYFGSQGLYCYDLDGTRLWERDFGDQRRRNQFGEGSTPAVHGDTIVVVWDHQGDSFIVALDTRTGEERWRVARDEIDSWATPLIVDHDGRHQVVTGALSRVRSYDLETGELIWESEGLTMNPIPSPVAADGIVYLTAGYRGNDLKAIRLADAAGDITGTAAIVWSLDRDTPYVPSPLLYDHTLYLLKSNSAILSAFDAESGAPHYRTQRLAGVSEVYASPVGAAGRVYIAGRDGTTLVLAAGRTFDVLATNTLDDGFDASPAVVGGTVYLRGYRHLYALASEK